MDLTRILTDPVRFLFTHKFRKYCFEKFGSANATEPRIGFLSGWMHINRIYIRYRRKINLDEKKTEKIFFRVIFWKMYDFRSKYHENTKNHQ